MAGRSDRNVANIELSARAWGVRAATAYGAARLALRVALGGIRHRPRAQTVSERLASLPQQGLPVEAPVEIRWNDHLVPFIAAQSDRDLAIALGLVHGHLRLAQMEFLRRIAHGRVAEALGAIAVPLDRSLRALDVTRAVPAIVAGLPRETRDWLDGFVAGINHHLVADVASPLEFRLLGLRAEPWSVADVVATARLVAIDVNWLLWRRLLRHPRGADWPELWARMAAADAAELPSGSNAIAVSGRRSASGQPWLAGDPHLPLSLPSIWLAAAYRSPSYNVAGLMIPGIPAALIGRNPHLAWGGTNLHAASSELFDVSDLPPGEIAERHVSIAVRWSRPRDIVLRDTAYGPIVTGTPLYGSTHGKTVALRWVGYAPSDEITALLAINRAHDAASFRRAAEMIAVPGQNLVFAERAGRIGHVRAAWLPRRPAAPPCDPISPRAALAAWATFAGSADLPARIDPAEGFVVSANNRPEAGDHLIGWFFAPGDRATRLASRLWACERVDLEELCALLTDTASIAGADLRERLCAALDPPPEGCPVFDALMRWDGRYDAGSSGALAFELVWARLIAAHIADERRTLLGTVWHSRSLLIAELDKFSAADFTVAIRAALAEVRPIFLRLRDWGGAHRLRLAHPLGALPRRGRRYRFIDWPWSGSGDTVFKSAHGPVAGRHNAGYGSNARYIFDLADPDANRLVILGGQDGAPDSIAFLDQAELFRRGEYVEVPLSPETARRSFPHVTMLEP